MIGPIVLEFLARLAGLAVGYSIVGAYLAWRTRHERDALRPSTGSPYRAPFSDAGLAPTADPREAWDAGVAAERARVLGLVDAVHGSSRDDDVHRACDALRDGVKAGPR